MNFHDRFSSSKEAKEDGTWVDLGGEVKIKVRALDSVVSRAFRKKIEEPLQPLIRANNGSLPDDKALEIMIKQLAGAVLVDWKGVTNEANENVPFTTETAEKYLTKYEDFRQEIATIVTSRETWKKQVRLEDLGNSSAS